MSTKITTDFSTNFASEHWEQHPAYFQGFFAPVFYPLDELFNTVTGMPEDLTASDRYWVSKRDNPVAKDEFRTVPLGTHGPRSADTDFNGFFERAASEFPGSRFGINLHQLEKASPALWFRFRELVQAINLAVGTYPSGKWDIDTFIGTYKVSPLGIHRDNASVFVTGLTGRRTYYLWPPEYFKPGDAALQTLDPDVLKPHLDNATRFELAPGDLVYWPSSNWHLICSDGEPSVVVSVSAYFGKKMSVVISNQISNLLAGYLGEGNEPDTFDIATAGQPPQALVKAHQLTMQAARSGQISDMLQQYWIRFLSADGMHALQSDTNTRLAPDQLLRVDSRYPIHHMHSATGGLIVSANGQIIVLPIQQHSALESMLQQLNTGEVTSAADLVKQYAQAPVTAEEVTNLLDLLNRCHTFLHL